MLVRRPWMFQLTQCWRKTNGSARRNAFRNHNETHYFAADDKPKTDSFNRRATQLNSSFIDRVRASTGTCALPAGESVRAGTRLPR